MSRVDELAAEALGQRDDADRQRGPGGDAALRLEALATANAASACRRRVQVEPDQLGGAAADVEHQREVAAEIDQRGAAGDRQLGLRLAAHDLDVEPGLAACRAPGTRRPLAASRQASVAIRPARATRCRSILAAHTLQRLDRALDGGLRQAAARGDALAEADDAREGVDHLEAAPRRARDQQPAVVGAEIERGIGGPRRRAPGRRMLGSMRRRRRHGRALARQARRQRRRACTRRPPHTRRPRRAARLRRLGPSHPPPSFSGARFRPRWAFGRHSG